MIKIERKEDCSGCWACQNVCPKQCIAMTEDSEGFSYPRVDLDLCIDCHLCEKVCPIINAKPDEERRQRAFLIQHKNKKILSESTSGGAFSAIAQWVIGNGGVVFGAAFDEDFVVTHQFADSIDGLSKFRNSKYVQSHVGDSFNQALKFLKDGRWVLFSGTPCQLEGFLRFLRKPYDRLITLDVMCKSITSPGVFRRYVKEKSEKLNIKPDKILFRDKNPFGYEYSQMSFYKDGKQIYRQGVETDEYLRSFFSDMNVRPSCYECMFKKRHHLTDFTIWDCFDVAKFDKRFDNNRGVTRVLANSELALKILDSLEDIAMLKEIPLNNAIADTTEMVKSVNLPQDRNRLFDGILAGKPLKSIYPMRLRNRLERFIRVSLSKLGIYSAVKNFAKLLIKDLKRA